MIGTVIGFILSPFGRIAMYAVGALFASGIIFGLIKMHNDNIRAAALAQYNKMQLEQIADDQRNLVENLKELNKRQDEIGMNLDRKKEVTTEKVENIKKKIELEKDNASSPVLRSVLEELLKEVRKGE